MNSMSLVRGMNATLGHLAPELAARQMRRVFTIPHTPAPRAWERPWEEGAERVTLRFGLSALRWGSGPAVLLQHGWEGRPTQFAVLIEALLDAGFAVVALDGPAHGRSPGREATPVQFARALIEAAAELPPLRALVGHSMGGASAMLAVQMGLRVEQLITVSAPSRLLLMLERFSRFVGLPPLAGERFIAQIERRAGMPVSELDVSRYLLPMPGLVVHAADDKVVPAGEARRIHQFWPGSRLLELEQGGHSQVLADPRLVEAVLAQLGAARPRLTASGG